MATSIRRNFLSAIVLTSILGLNGCFSPVDNAPAKTYVLSPTLPTVAASKKTKLTLLVEAPIASPALNTNEMAYVEKTYQLAYFSKNRWVDTPALMLQPLIIQALQNANYYKAVAASPFIGDYDMVLNTRLLTLQQNFLQSPSQIQLSLRAQLVNYKTRQVIASKQFDIVEPTSENTPYGGVVAANRATTQLLQQLTEFCLQAPQK